MERNTQVIQRGRPVSGLDAAHANEYFEQFVNASTLKHILGYYRGLIDNLHLKPNVFSSFYPKLRANLTSWRAKALWKKFDARASHKCYGKGKISGNTRVLIIGGGPCGLRSAIEAQLLGAKVVVIEKRDRFSRNNVLHLWPFVIEDLRMLGAKKFFGKFCAGAIDHISIRQLQCILLKVALLLGVEVHTEVSFEKLIEPNATEKTGWRAEFKPSNHPVNHYEFDVIIGADGKRNTLQGFSRKEFRGKLAIAITANFINRKTEAEARVEEISGVAFIFNQKFFKELQEETRIDLENIVYYKDDTHYFVMTAKKASLLEKCVIKQDLADTEKLLAPDNVDREALQQYAIDAANFSTNYQLPQLEFAVNHYGQPDIAMFDFTSMYAAENASKMVERNGYKLLMILVGDSLLEPFWPTGSGCARGFLSSLDAAWAIRSWSIGNCTPLEVLAERESIYRLLAQTTPDNLNKDWKSYTVDPSTRYPNLNKTVVLPHQAVNLYDTDNPASIEKMKRNSHERTVEAPRKRRRGNVDNEILLSWLRDQLKEDQNIQIRDIESVFKGGKILCAIIHHYRPDLLDYNSIQENDPTKNNQLAFDVLEKELGIPPVMTGEEITNTEDYLTMATYLTEVYNTFRGEIPHIKHPKLELPESTKHSDLSFKTIKTSNVQILTTQQSRPSSRHKRHVETAPKPCSIDNKKTRKRRTLEKIGVSVDHENKAIVSTARGGGTDEDVAARIKSLQKKWSEPQPVDRKPKDLLRAIGKIETSDWNIKEIEKKIMENKMGKPNKTFDKEKVPKWSKEQFLARQTKMEKQHLDRQDSTEAKFADIDKSIKNLDQKLKEGTVRQLGTNKIATLTEKLVSKVPPEPKPPEKTATRPPMVLPTPSGSEFCHFCRKRVYLMERLSAEGRFFHHGCFKCQYCNTQLRLGSYAFDRDGLYGFKFFCLHHFGMVGEIPPTKVARKPSQKLTVDIRKSPEKKSLTGITGVDLLDRVQTPERIEFSNLSSGHISSDHEDPLSQMDEDEWTDKNFGASCAEMVDSDEESSSLSDTDSDDEDAFDDALEEPVTKEGTMKWAERWKNSYSKKRHTLDSDGYSSSDQSSYYDSSDDDESDTATEGEEEIRARELRKQEVRVEPPVVQTDTGTDTEIVTDESSTESSSEVHNSATEISTDSEFAQDDPTPTRELPIILSDFNVTKTRGSGRNYPKKIQVTTGYLQKPIKEKTKRSNPHIELKLKPLVPLAPIKKPAPLLLPRTEGYSLNRTQSTGGIAAKVSLELKKKYLLGEPTPGNIQKSGSASTLDTKFKTFQTNISDCQKLLKPAPEISASMQTFVTKLDERKSPILSPQSSMIFGKDFTKLEESSNKNPSLFTDPIITKVTVNEAEQSAVSEKAFENESEGRPRSPVHETSIIVPQIDWSKNHQSLSSDSLASSDSENDVLSKPKPFENIPRVEVHEAKDEEKEENLHDSLTDPQIENKSVQNDNISVNSHSEAPKSISSEKKTLNQPKTLPSLETMLPEIHNSLHIKFNKADNRFSREISEIETKSQKNSSGLSSPDSVAEQITAALTETELSDWARDDAVSDDFEEVAFDISHIVDKTSSNVKKAKMAEFDDIESTAESKHNVIDLNNKTILTEAMNNVLSSNLDNIEFMDTGTETSSDDGIPDSQSGYILFKNEDEFAEDSLNPNINEIFEAKNIHLNEKGIKNTGYCIIINEDNTVEDKTADIEKTAKNLSVNNEQEEDSLLVLETAGTTTEENTFSDSTVKNLTEISVDKQETPVKLIENNNSIKQRLEEKLATIKAEAKLKEKETNQQHEDNIEFDEHCKRLQSKVEFSNAKDSIDIRKSRRKSKSDSPQKPDLIQEEKIENKDITLTLSPTPHTPDILYNKDVIKKERDVNQKLIQEMVMNKMKAENKSLERKKRTRTAVSPSSPFALSKSATTDIVSQINLNNLDKNNRKSTYSTSSSNYSTPDVLLSSNIIPLQNSVSVSAVPTETSLSPSSRPLSIHPVFSEDTPEKIVKTNAKEETQTFSTDNAQFTPKAPPRQHRLNNDDVNKKLEKLKQMAKSRNKGNSNGAKNVEVVEHRHSWLHSNDNLNKKKNHSFRRSKSGDSEIEVSKLRLSLSSTNIQQIAAPVRTKSIPEIPKRDMHLKEIDLDSKREQMCKSDPNILEIDKVKPKKKSKDRERRKSITKLLTTLFTKKSPGSNGSKGLFSKLSPKSKELSKESMQKQPTRRNSFSEITVERNILTPPPIPPLPQNYSIKGTDESSDGEQDCKKDHSSCDTLDKLGTLEFSTSSNTGRRSSKALRAARQAQLKRHRMAQEIQRKLEETEVKTKELETRGVLVEKALRGEDSGENSNKDESELLQEWFDLMRDRTELRRYERELGVRAQELELEDRHARLQHELRDRLENNEPKTDKELKIEEDIINEMMAIVAERDSLISVIEEDRLRYSNEDRDLEEQMLAKGLRLTPIKKSPEK